MKAAIDRLGRRVLGMVSWGRVTTGNDSGSVQSLQVQHNNNEVGDNRPRLAEFGFTSMPPDGSDAVVLFLGGDRSNGIVIATGNQATRMQGLASGESALYDAIGKHIYLNAGYIEINAAGQPVNVINASTVNVTCSGAVNVTAAGSATVSAPNITLQNTGSALRKICNDLFVSLFNGHTHNRGPAPDQQAVEGTHTTNIVSAE